MQKTLVCLAAVAVLGVSLSGCAINPANLSAANGLVQSLAAAGCSGTIHLSTSATTAAMGVPSASLANTFDGTCNPANAKPPVVPPAP